jgi:clan AA aspartic protease
MNLANMGITYADIELINSLDLALLRRGSIPESEIKRTKVRALVDSGASLLTIPESIRDQLDLQKVDEQQAELADGSLIAVDVVGPVEVRFMNRKAITAAMVVPQETEVLLGAVPMQMMDVLIDPKQERLIVNPKSPDRARMLLK